MRTIEVTIWTMDCDTDADGCQVHVFTTKADLELWQRNALNDEAEYSPRLRGMLDQGEPLADCWEYFLEHPANHLDNYNVDEHTIKIEIDA